MFDPFFNENDQLEIVLGCSLKNFTKFIGHPVISSKRLFSSSERYAVFLGLILLLSSNPPITYLTYLFLVTSSLRDTGNLNGHRVPLQIPACRITCSPVTLRDLACHAACDHCAWSENYLVVCNHFLSSA